MSIRLNLITSVVLLLLSVITSAQTTQQSIMIPPSTTGTTVTITVAPTPPQPRPVSVVGVNLEALSYGMRGSPYADAMLTAQPFYQGSDPQGNPTVSGSTVIVATNITPGFAGTYKLVGTGQFNVSPSASAIQVQNLSFSQTLNTTTADLVLSTDAIRQVNQICLTFSWANVSPPPKNIHIYRPGVDPSNPPIFNKTLTGLIAPFSTIRFMDAQATNNSTLADFSQRPLPSQRNFTTQGMPLEHCIALCQQTGKDGWLCIPYLVATSPNGLQAYAQWLAANIPIDSKQTYTVVISNEIWNSSFAQWKQNQNAATTNTALRYDGMGDPNILGWRQTAWLIAQFSREVCRAYGTSSWRDTPIRPVLEVQWGNPSVAQYGLQFLRDRVGNPQSLLFGLADAPYCTVDWTKNPQQPADYIADLLLINPNNNLSLANAALAKQYGLHYLAYEFGFDFGQNPGNAPQRAAAQILPSAGLAVTQAIDNWLQAGGEGLNWYNLSYPSQNSGNWGLVEDIFTPSVPKYNAAVGSAKTNTWNSAPVPTTQPSAHLTLKKRAA